MTKEKKEELPSTEVKEDENLEELLKKNLQWSKIIYDQNRVIKRRLLVMVLGSYLKLIIIIVPLVLAIIYLPPLLEPYFNQVSGLLFGGGGGNQVGQILNQVSGGGLEDVLSNVSTEQIRDVLKVLQP